MADPKSPYPPALSPSSTNVFSDNEVTKPIRIKFTSSSASAVSPTTEWKTVARQVEADSRKHGNQSPPSSDVGSPVAKQLDPRDRLTYGKIPMDESPELVSCEHCKRPIIRHALKDHVESCIKKKASSKVSATIPGAAKEHSTENDKATPNGEIAVMPPKSKKRKHDDVAESAMSETTPPKKKSSKRDKETDDTSKKEKKKKTKPAAAKPKLPVDVEKQCGVFDPEKGIMCARSLTCKSHSMAAKRAVAGRSQRYDDLLVQWQRKNQARTATVQKPVLQQETEDVDSEEEVRLVVQGASKRYCRPMEQRVIVGVRRKVRGVRLYEGLRSALLGGVQSMGGAGSGRGRRQSQAADV